MKWRETQKRKKKKHKIKWNVSLFYFVLYLVIFMAPKNNKKKSLQLLKKIEDCKHAINGLFAFLFSISHTHHYLTRCIKVQKADQTSKSNKNSSSLSWRDVKNHTWTQTDKIKLRGEMRENQISIFRLNFSKKNLYLFKLYLLFT